MLRKNDSPSPVELRDVAPGLWIWRVQHPRWRPGQDSGAGCGVDLRGVRGRETRSGSACSSLRAVEAWNRLDARTPTAVVILRPDHVRDVDLFVNRYQCLQPKTLPSRRHARNRTEAGPTRAASCLVALYDGRGRNETPL